MQPTTTIRRAGALAALGMTSTLLFAPSATAADAPSARAAAEPDTEYGRMMLVLDSSGSMKEKAAGGQTKIEAARGALDGVIADLPDEADVGLQVFGATVFSRTDKGACTDTQVVVAPGTDNRDELSAAVQKYKPYGETPIPAALTKASRALGSEGRRSIVLVSDGESTCGNPCDVAADIGQSGIDIQIDVVGLSVSGKARKQLQCVADAGKGTYYDADDAEDLSKSLERISERAVRPFVVQGTPVEGSTSPSNAPEIASGVWRDKLPGEGQELHYRIERTIPGSTLWVGMVAQPGKEQQQAQLRLTADGDKDCGTETATNSILGTDDARLLGVAIHNEDEEWCADADVLDLGVAMTEFSDGDADAPMQVTVFEEPPLANTDGLEPGVEWNAGQVWEKHDHSGEPEKVTPGNSLSNAPELEPGTYDTGGIVPGEAQVFKVHLDWGESLQARAVLPVSNANYAHYGVLAPVVRMNVLSTLGGEVRADHPRDEYDELLSTHAFPPTSVQQGTEYVHAKTAPVRWRNREEFEMSNLALPGDYYVVISQAIETDGDSAVTPMHLEIDKVSADETDPSYANGAEVTGPESVAEDGGTAADDPGNDDAGGQEENGALKLVAGGTAIGLGTIALLGAALLLLRRRARGGVR